MSSPRLQHENSQHQYRQNIPQQYKVSSPQGLNYPATAAIPVKAEYIERDQSHGGITENPMRLSASQMQNDSYDHSLYGQLQHEIRQKVISSPHCCSKIELETVAQFFDSILIVKKSHVQTVCCCCKLPDSYSMQAVPKYKLRNVSIAKEGAEGCCVICCPPSPNFIVSIGMSEEKEKGNKSIWEYLALPEKISLITAVEPNSQFLFSYVYGPLCGKMTKVMHRLSHMINDDLTEKLTPKGMDDLNV